MQIRVFCRQALGLALGGIVWSAVWGGPGAIAPGLAEPARFVYSMSIDETDEFNGLIQQAEAAAQTAIDQAFATNSSLTDISVQIVGDRNGELVPLITVTVARADWQRNPNVQAWSQYYGMALTTLLGFRAPESEPQRSPGAISFGYVPPPEGIRSTSSSSGVSGISRQREEEALMRDPAYRDD